MAAKTPKIPAAETLRRTLSAEEGLEEVAAAAPEEVEAAPAEVTVDMVPVLTAPPVAPDSEPDADPEGEPAEDLTPAAELPDPVAEAAVLLAAAVTSARPLVVAVVTVAAEALHAFWQFS